MHEWYRDLIAVQARLPCRFARLVPPRLILLPAWWPARNSIWIYFSFIFVGRDLIDAPRNARRYLIGHEYGHIYCGHVWMHYGYWIAVVGVAAGILVGTALMLIPALFASMILVAAIWPRAMERRECAADLIAVRAWGAIDVIQGAVWFTQQRGPARDELRIVRLAFLRSYANSKITKSEFGTFKQKD